jgi:hypothetical protein
MVVVVVVEPATAFALLTAVVVVISYENYFIVGKAVPLQAWSGSEGSRKLRFPDFLDNGIGWW